MIRFIGTLFELLAPLSGVMPFLMSENDLPGKTDAPEIGNPSETAALPAWGHRPLIELQNLELDLPQTYWIPISGEYFRRFFDTQPVEYEKGRGNYLSVIECLYHLLIALNNVPAADIEKRLVFSVLANNLAVAHFCIGIDATEIKKNISDAFFAVTQVCSSHKNEMTSAYYFAISKTWNYMCRFKALSLR